MGIMYKLIDGPYSNKPPRGWLQKQERQKAKLLKAAKKWPRRVPITSTRVLTHSLVQV